MNEASAPTLEGTIRLVVGVAAQDQLLPVLKVMASLETEEERITSLLRHFVRETGSPLDELRRLGYSERVISALDEMAPRKNGVSRQEVRERVLANPLASRVLIAELEESQGRHQVSLRTERLHLRELRRDDWQAIHCYARDPEVVRHLDWGPNTEEQTKSELDEAIARRASIPRLDFFLVVVLRQSDQVVGGCGLTIAKGNAQTATLGYTLNKDHWGKGYATESATAMVRFGFERLHLHRITANCDVLNVESIRVLEKLGMKREGQLRHDRYHLGRWRDTLVYGILAHELVPSDSEGRPGGAVLGASPKAKT